MTGAENHLPRPRRVRARLAVGLTISTLLVAAAVAVGATALAAWRPSDSGPATQAGAARVGEEVTVVIVTDEGAEMAAARARRDTLRWSLIALVISVIPAIGVGWFAAGRVLGTVNDALANVDAAEEERRKQMQEVVHELRTPLAVMGTNLELAATEPELEQGAVELIEAARRAVDRMGRTVDDLAGHGGLAVEASEGSVDLARLAYEVVADHAGPARARGIHLVAAGDRPVHVPEADRAAVGTAVGNFVSNAVRLAPRGSAITIDWGIRHGWAWLAVMDEGPGIARRFHGRVFERGWRGRHERDRNDIDVSAGLGLTIARQLTEALSGVVTLDSEEGGGSVFAVWLPKDGFTDAGDVMAPDAVHSAVQPWAKNLLPS